MTKYIKDRYGDAPIIITENGVPEANNYTLPINEAVQDYLRIRYHRLHLNFLIKAINWDGVNVRGYLVWSLFDDFEWNDGYAYRFGLIYIYYKRDLTRYIKYSALWLKRFLQKQNASSRLGYSPI
ncbi:hypothetical protein Dimus_033329 [Dionaea muscipula]